MSKYLLLIVLLCGAATNKAPEIIEFEKQRNNLCLSCAKLGLRIGLKGGNDKDVEEVLAQLQTNVNALAEWSEKRK